MKNYNLSLICKRAHELIRAGYTKSAAFKQSWAETKAAKINFSEMARQFEQRKALIEALQAEQDMLKENIIAYLNGREEVEENGYRVKYITVIRNILDTPRFKSENRELYELYLKENQSKRFTVTAEEKALSNTPTKVS